MKKILLVVAALCMLSTGARAASDDDFANSPFGQELVSLGMKFLDNPPDFFFNLHCNNEDFSPLPSDSRGSIRFNFFPTFFPTTWANLNVKVKVLNEHGVLPQLDLVGTYGNIIALQVLDNSAEDDRKLNSEMSDYAGGIVLSKNVEKETRLFGGAKYSSLRLKFDLPDPIILSDDDPNTSENEQQSIDGVDFRMSDVCLFTGITHEVGKHKYVVAQVSYGLQYKKIVSRVMMSHKHLELGLDIFPEGLFVLHPFMAWHWYF
jgi:hypothetical protein